MPRSRHLQFFRLFCFFALGFIYTPSFSQLLVANAGTNTSVCAQLDSVKIGGNPSAVGGTPPYTYQWSPTSSLDNFQIANPNAFPSTNTSYTLTVTDSTGFSSTDVVDVMVDPGPSIVAGPDLTITGGNFTNLQASGGDSYIWYPQSELNNPAISNPQAEPVATTTFCVVGTGANGCKNYDCMILYVIPSDTLIIYNVFTPNDDGDNDVLYIGNLGKFPNNTLEVYNRNGKLVFRQAKYQNTWNGKIDGSDLPAATYYVVIDPGDGFKKVGGAVTIIR